MDYLPKVKWSSKKSVYISLTAGKEKFEGHQKIEIKKRSHRDKQFISFDFFGLHFLLNQDP